MRYTLGVAIREMAIKASGDRGREWNNEGHESHWNSNTDGEKNQRRQRRSSYGGKGKVGEFSTFEKEKMSIEKMATVRSNKVRTLDLAIKR